MSPKVVSLNSFINQIIGENKKTKELQRRAIEVNKQIEEFDGYKYCSDECYRCSDIGICERAVKKEGSAND